MVDYMNLVNEAIKARNFSHSPYSKFKVGAAILCSDGSVFKGCNIENASYSETVCAERVAIFNAISQGKSSFTAIAIVGGKDGVSDYTYPCGACRQVLSEFCDSTLEVVLYSGKDIKICTLGQLFPFSFGKSDIK